MNDTSSSSFSHLLAVRQAEFISYREAMEKLAAFTDENLTIIAAVLKGALIHTQEILHLSGPELTLTKAKNSSPIAALLDHTINCDEIREVVFGNGPSASPNTLGWFREGLIRSLRSAKLPCPPSLEVSEYGQIPLKNSVKEPFQSWTAPYVGRVKLSLLQSASFLAGSSPIQSELLSEEHRTNISEWKGALIDAIDHGEIEASAWTDDRDIQQMLSHFDIRRWCATRGHVWPIPEPIPTPENDAELMERLRNAETSLAEANQLLAVNEKVIAERDSLKARWLASEGEARGLSAVVMQLKEQLAQAKSDEATGKSKSTMLRLIAGLAMAGVEMNVHDQRLTGSMETLKLLELKGVTIDPKTFRNYLLEGASLISKEKDPKTSATNRYIPVGE